MTTIVVLVLVAACSGAPGFDPEAPTPTAPSGAGDAILPMTLTNWMYAPQSPPATGEPLGLAHLSVTPLEPGANTLEIVLTDLDGSTLTAAPPSADAVLTVRQLAPDAQPTSPPLPRSGERDAVWTTGEVDLPEQGWYELTVALEVDDMVFGATTMYALLPDPSVHGAAALDLPETDPEARAPFDRALERYAAWNAVRWRESLGSGADVLVVTDFALTNRPAERAAFKTETRYIGAFRPRSDGSPPAAPRFNDAGSITIDDTAWRRRGGSGWEEVSTVGVATQPERADIFIGASNIRFAGTDRIDGRDVQVITYYLPPDGGQSEAWFAWWIDPETSDVLRVAMVASMHFMIWDFFDINGSFTIASPPGVRTATPTGDE